MDIQRRIVCSMDGFNRKEVLSVTEEYKDKITCLRYMGRGYASIAKELGLSKNTVKSFCRRNCLTSAELIVTDGQGRCRACGALILQQPKMKKRVFCCTQCRQEWWAKHPEQIRRRAVYAFTCAKCGKPFTAYGNQKRKYCCHACYIADRFGGESHA